MRRGQRGRHVSVPPGVFPSRIANEKEMNDDHSPMGNVHALAEAVAEGATDADAQVHLRRVARARAARVNRLESGVTDSQELTRLQPLVIKDTDSSRSRS